MVEIKHALVRLSYLASDAHKELSAIRAKEEIILLMHPCHYCKTIITLIASQNISLNIHTLFILYGIYMLIESHKL